MSLISLSWGILREEVGGEDELEVRFVTEGAIDKLVISHINESCLFSELGHLTGGGGGAG